MRVLLHKINISGLQFCIFFTLINEKTVGDAGPSKFSKVKKVLLVSQSR